MTLASRWTRRNALRAGSVGLALLALESLAQGADDAATIPTRLVCVGTYLGFHQSAFFPQQARADYELPELLQPLADHRDQFTVFSGLDHRAANGHGAWNNFLCGQKPGSYSLDQMVADQLGHQTRYASLQLSAGKASRTMSHTRTGVALPMIERPSVVFRKLFGAPGNAAREEYLLRSGSSVLDAVAEDAQALQRSVSQADRRKLDEYFDSLRDVEKRLAQQLQHGSSAVPQTDYKLPDYDPVAPTLQLEAENLMYDLMTLALETDSSRVVSLFIGGLG